MPYSLLNCHSVTQKNREIYKEAGRQPSFTEDKFDEFDVAFVEGAIANKRDELKLKEIREKSKKLVAIGACAVNGMPASQRNLFDPETKKEIEFLIQRFNLNDKVYALHELVQVDDNVSGCPMVEATFLQVLNKYLKEFGVTK